MAISFWLMALAAQVPAAPVLPSAPSAALSRFVASPAYQANIARLFAALPSDVFQRCGTLVSAGSKVAIIQPVSFDADGAPVTGVWKQSFPVSGCGNDTIINFFFQGQPAGRVATVTAAPGTTHADLTLQRDAVRYVMLAAGTLAKGCSALHLRDTRYEGLAASSRASVGGKSTAQPWRETWSVAACGAILAVSVNFIPDATGTTISTEPPKPVAP